MKKEEENKICFLCEHPILPEDRTFMIPFDRPYGNIPVHHPCWKVNQHNYPAFLDAYREKILEILS